MLGSRGDVSVGLFAAQQRRRRILLGLLGAALTVAAVWLYFALRPGGGEPAAGQYRVLVRCAKCGQDQVATVTAGEEAFPLPCKSCGERACQRLWQCRNCGHRFLLKGTPGSFVCPNCGRRNIGAAELPEADGRNP